MADIFTGTSDITGPPQQVGQTNLITTAFDLKIGWKLRSEPMFRQFAEKHPAQVSHSGNVVRLQLHDYLSVSTTPLTENVDPDSVALPNTSYVDITPQEYGRVVKLTEKHKLSSLAAVEPATVQQISDNMRDTLDQLVRTVANGGTRYVKEINQTLVDDVTTGLTSDVGDHANDKLQSKHIRFVVSKLRARSAQPFGDGNFIGLIHPDQSLDLQSEVGDIGWRVPHIHSGANALWNGEVGIYHNVRFIETPRAYQATDGNGSAKVSRLNILGREALAEAVVYEPKVVIGPVTDKLERSQPIGWKGFLGWARYREDAMYRVETITSY